MMNSFCGMVDWRKAFSLISSWDPCQRSSPLQISDTSQAEFEHVQNLSSGLVESRFVVVITTAPTKSDISKSVGELINQKIILSKSYYI